MTSEARIGRHCVAEANRAAGVTTVGEDHQDFSPGDLCGAVEIHAELPHIAVKPSGWRDRIRSTSRAKSCWPNFVTRTSVSKSTSHVARVVHRVEELDRCGPRHLDIGVHAPAGVEQEPDVEVGARLQVVAPRELLEVCGLPSSRISKSSMERSVRCWPRRSVTVAVKLTSSVPARKVACWAARLAGEGGEDGGNNPDHAPDHGT